MTDTLTNAIGVSVLVFIWMMIVSFVAIVYRMISED